MRLGARFGLIASLLCSLLARPAAAKELDVRFHPQHTQVWCWGATIAMVVEYLQRFRVEDCMILAEYDMRLGGRGMCCLGAMECQRAGATREMLSIMGSVFGIQGQFFPRPLCMSEVHTAIDNGWPLIAQLMSPMSSGHVVLISGYTESGELVVLDPLSGRSLVPYQNLIQGGRARGVWSGTFVNASVRAAAPNCWVLREQVPCPRGFCPGPRQRLQCAPLEQGAVNKTPR
jgi:hypothetical protein